MSTPRDTELDHERKEPQPPPEQPNELTGVAPNGDGKVSNRPTNTPTQIPPPD